MHAGAQGLIVLAMLEKFVVFVPVVLVGNLKHEFVDHALPQDLSLEHEGIAVLLDLGIVEGRFDHVAVEFEGAPHTLHLQRVVEGELLVDEPEGMVRPVVVVAILS